MNFKMLEGEKIVKEGKANRTNLLISQGGELCITNKRLVFVGHGFNVGEGTITINLEDILILRNAFTWTIALLLLPIPNAFKVVLKDGKNYKFGVFGRKEWLSILQNKIK